MWLLQFWRVVKLVDFALIGRELVEAAIALLAAEEAEAAKENMQIQQVPAI
jgi:hypothetical protein